MYAMNDTTANFINYLYKYRDELFPKTEEEDYEEKVVLNELKLKNAIKKNDIQKRYTLRFVHHDLNGAGYDRVFEYETPEEITAIEKNEELLYAATFDEALNKAWQAFGLYYDYLKNSGIFPTVFSKKHLIEDVEYMNTVNPHYFDFRTGLWKNIEIVDTIGNDGFIIDVNRWLDIYTMLSLFNMQPKKKTNCKKKTADKNEYSNVREKNNEL